MSFTTGTATDFHDLLDQLRKYMTGVKEILDSSYTGTGDGTMTGLSAGSSAVTETWTVECTMAAGDGGTFSVTGSVTGAQTDASVGVAYDNGYIAFTINDGATDFEVGDTWEIDVYGSEIASAWTELDWDAPSDINDTARLIVQGDGAGAGQEVYAWIETQTDAVNGYYTWSLRSMTDYDSGQVEDNQENVSPARRFVSLHASTIDYWFYVNDRRFIVIAKCGAVYISFYLGFFLPWGLPSEYPFPIYIGGCGQDDYSVSETRTSFRFFADPGVDTSWLLTADYEWISVVNHNDGTEINLPLQSYSADGIITWPFHQGGASLSSANFGNWSGAYNGYTTGGGLDGMRPTAQGERPLFPVEFTQRSSAGELGAMDGVFCVPGNALVSEQLVSIGADDYRVFQNIFRTSGNDFIAIKEV